MTSLSSSSANAFADLALGYCAWCEGSSLGADRDAIATAWLSKLYAAALALPEVEPDNSEGLPDIPEEVLAKAIIDPAL